MAISDVYKQVYGTAYGFSNDEYNRRYSAGEDRINRATADANRALRTSLANTGFAGGRALSYGGAQIGANRMMALRDLDTEILNQSDEIARQQKAMQFGALTQEEMASQQHGYQLEYMSVEQKNTLARMDQQQKYDLIKMAQQYEYDKDLMKLQKELNKRGWGSLLGTIVGTVAGTALPGVGNALGSALGGAIGGWFGGNSSSGGGYNTPHGPI